MIGAIQTAAAERLVSGHQIAYLSSLRTPQDAVFAGASTVVAYFLSSTRSAWREALGGIPVRLPRLRGDIAVAFGAATGDALDPATLMSVGQAVVIAPAYAGMGSQTQYAHAGEISGGTAFG